MEFDDENVITTDGESTIKDEDNDNLIEIANAYRTILKVIILRDDMFQYCNIKCSMSGKMLIEKVCLILQ